MSEKNLSYTIKVYRERNEIKNEVYREGEKIIDDITSEVWGKDAPKKILNVNYMKKIADSQKELFLQVPKLNSLEIKVEIEND